MVQRRGNGRRRKPCPQVETTSLFFHVFQKYGGGFKLIRLEFRSGRQPSRPGQRRHRRSDHRRGRSGEENQKEKVREKQIHLAKLELRRQQQQKKVFLMFRKSKVAESPLPDEFCVEEDDIINDSCSPIPQQALFSAPQGQSQPVGKLFVERTKRFQAAERSDWRTTGEQMDGVAELQHMPPLWTTRDVSVRVHEGFRVFGLFCHGFLAGYAVWNVVVVYMLAGQHLTALRNLLEQYHGLAYPSQALLYILLAICTVASFDRVNLAKGPVALRQFITLDPVALASFLYFSALILSLSQQMTSDRINLYASSNTTIWPAGSEHQILHPWVTINLVVALLVGLAWIFIATRPETDYTEAGKAGGQIRNYQLKKKKKKRSNC
uniref:Transmembrane protein 237b n=1 Tax=Poecilia reticulata TaxID=8081 RepID=A0A3P9PK42_POERE